MADEPLEPQAQEPEVVEVPEEPQTPDVQETADDEPVTPESLAGELGWAPKDEWRGDPADWKDAKTFLKSTVDINKTLRKDLKATRDASERAARAAASITEAALEKQRQELLQTRQQAFDAGDQQTFNVAEAQLRQLPQPSVPAQSNESQEFVKRNSSWYGIDPIASQMAYAICDREAAKGADFATQLQEAEKVIRQRFPEYFRDTSKGPAQVATPGTRASAAPRKGPKGYADLPSDAKRACDDFVRRGRTTKEEYCKEYFGQENA